MDERPFHKFSGLIYLIAFLTSLCSLAYQQVMVIALAEITTNFVLSQALGIGAYLLGLGLASVLFDKVIRASWASFGRLELLLCACGVFSVTYVRFIETVMIYFFTRLGPSWAILPVAPLLTLIGFLVGLEMPLLFKLRPDIPVSRIIGWNYFGSLAGAVIVPLLLLPKLDLPNSALALAALNFAVALTVIALTPMRRVLLWRAGVTAALIGMWLPIARDFDVEHLKFIYSGVTFNSYEELPGDIEHVRDFDPVRRIRTPYQWVDLVHSSFYPYGPDEKGMTLYLDRHPQFYSGTIAVYHESMVHGGINLLGHTPESVLILGGGDGLLLPELLKYRGELKSIHQVELDTQMIKLATTDPEFTKLNKNSFADPLVHLEMGDAFHYIRHHKEQYELILIDLPFPNNMELSMLFTREFYAILKKRIAPGGIVIVDFPIPPDGDRSRGLSTFLATLRKEGFQNIFGYGRDEPFLALSAERRDWAFDFDKLAPRLTNKTIQNLLSRDLTVYRKRTRPNSIFYPIDLADHGSRRGFGFGRERRAERFENAAP